MKTVQMTAAEVCRRTARFDTLQAMSTRKDISLLPSIGAAINAHGPGVLDEVKKIGLTFDAGVETTA